MADLPILVVSCDRYADLWRPFFELFWMRWPDCRGPVHLGTNQLVFEHLRVRTLAIGDDVTWAAGVLAMLDRIESDYVLLMLEDFLLMRRVDNDAVERLAALARRENLGCLRLYSIFPPERDLPHHPELGWFAPGDRYRITAQAAIWRVEMLRRLLVPGFSAWDFELVGSQLSDSMPDRIWGVKEPVLVYEQAVEKGRWRPVGVAICRQAGVEPDLKRRSVFTEAELAAHEQAASGPARFSEKKGGAIAAFKRGRRRDGLRRLAACLHEQPLAPQLWAIGAAGLLGPRVINSLHRAHLRAKVAKSRFEYQQRLRAVRRQAAAAR